MKGNMEYVILYMWKRKRKNENENKYDYIEYVILKILSESRM